MNSSADNILFIVNKHAGLGQAKELEQLVGAVCKKHGVRYDIQYTQSRGHATELSSMASTSKQYDRVVAVGGDGTINEVAKGLLNTGVPMGIVPKGSGNGLGRHLGIPLKTHDAIEALFPGKELAMDIFTVNGKLSLNVSGLGFDGHITNLFGIKSTRGFIGYITLTVQEFFRFSEFKTEISIDGEQVSRSAFIVAIANSSQYGNNAVIAPTASVCDGLLHISILKKVPLYRLDFLYAFFSGALDHSPFCEILKGKSLTLKTNEPVYYHVDGEPCGQQDTFEINLSPAALTIILPSGRNEKVNL